MGRCTDLYADVAGSNLSIGNLFFFRKELIFFIFLALGFRGFGSRV